MAGDLGVVGSGGDSAVRGDGHAAWIGGTTSIGRSPVERQQGIERPDFGAADPGDDVGQISCKGWYSTCWTLSDQVGAHGFRRLAWRWAVPSSPAPSVHRWRGSGA